MNRKLTLQEMMIRGSIGKKFCIKHYNWGIIKTKFPDMTRIIASPGQHKCRDLFREAVAYAKTVIIDKEKKREWQKSRKGARVHPAPHSCKLSVLNHGSRSCVRRLRF